MAPATASRRRVVGSHLRRSRRRVCGPREITGHRPSDLVVLAPGDRVDRGPALTAPSALGDQQRTQPPHPARGTPGRIPAGPSLHLADIRQGARLHRGRRADLGDRHRGRDGDRDSCSPRARAAAPVSAWRPAGHRRPSGRRRPECHRQCRIRHGSRLARAPEDDRRAGDHPRLATHAHGAIAAPSGCAACA